MKKKGQTPAKKKITTAELPDSRKNSLELLEEQFSKNKTCRKNEKVSKTYLGSSRSRSPVANEDIDIYLDSCLVEKKNTKELNHSMVYQKEKACLNS